MFFACIYFFYEYTHYYYLKQLLVHRRMLLKMRCCLELENIGCLLEMHYRILRKAETGW